MLDNDPILALNKTRDGWIASGLCSMRLGNLCTDPTSPHLPSAGWTFENDSLTVRSDQYGFVPLYYYDSPEAFGVSDSWVKLQRHFGLSRFDDAAIACYLRLGHYLAEDTPFEGVRRVPAGSTLIWSGGVLRVDRGSDAVPAPISIDRGEAVIEYGRRLRNAVADSVGSTKLLPISLVSGGQDSRHILLALNEIGVCPAHCMTQVPPWRGDQDDAVVALRLCRQLGVPVEIIEAVPSSIAAEFRKNRLLAMESAYHKWLLPLADTLCSMQRGLLFDGLGGDALSASRFLTDEWIRSIREGRVYEAASAYMGAEDHLKRMLQPGWLKRWPRALAEERVTAELSKHLDHPNPQAAFQIRNRTRRGIAAALWPLLARVHDVALPYFHPEVYEFLSALPMETLKGRRFHREAIDARYPGFRRVPYAVNGDRPPTLAGGFFPEVVCAGFALARQRALSTVLRPNYFRIRSARAVLQRTYVTYLEECLQPAVYLEQLFGLAARHDTPLRRGVFESVLRN